jgi:hypothetical protein
VAILTLPSPPPVFSSLSSSSLSSLAQLSQLSLSSSTFSEAAIPKVTTTTTTTQQRPRSTCGGCLIGFLGSSVAVFPPQNI